MCDSLVLVDCPGIVFPRLNVSPAMQVSVSTTWWQSVLGPPVAHAQHAPPSCKAEPDKCSAAKECQWNGASASCTQTPLPSASALC